MSEAFWTGVIHDLLVAIVPTLAGIAGIVAAFRIDKKFDNAKHYRAGASDARDQRQRRTDHAIEQTNAPKQTAARR